MLKGDFLFLEDEAMIRFLGSLMKYSIFIIGFFIYRTSFSQPPKELKPILEVAGTDSCCALGFYVKGIGDLNKDGYTDFAASAPY
jgi:FG-GAP repeat